MCLFKTVKKLVLLLFNGIRSGTYFIIMNMMHVILGFTSTKWVQYKKRQTEKD